MRTALSQSGLIREASRSLVLLLALCGVLDAQAPDTTKSGNGVSAKQTPATTSDQKVSSSAPLTPAEKRRADLQADTEKLYKLTQELKAEVDKSNKDTLSVSVIKKAQEVERLAKSIKERSKQQ